MLVRTPHIPYHHPQLTSEKEGTPDCNREEPAESVIRTTLSQVHPSLPPPPSQSYMLCMYTPTPGGSMGRPCV